MNQLILYNKADLGLEVKFLNTGDIISLDHESKEIYYVLDEPVCWDKEKDIWEVNISELYKSSVSKFRLVSEAPGLIHSSRMYPRATPQPTEGYKPYDRPEALPPSSKGTNSYGVKNSFIECQIEMTFLVQIILLMLFFILGYILGYHHPL